MKKKKYIKNTVYLFLGLIIAYCSFFVFPGIPSYLEYQKQVQAVGGCPFSEGGMVTKHAAVCVLDSACAPACTLCGISCPLVTGDYGTGCTAFTETQLASQNGSTHIAAPIGFPFFGKPVPSPGDQFLACMVGSTPLVVGLPSPSAMRVHKIKQWFDDFFIASFKKDE